MKQNTGIFLKIFYFACNRGLTLGFVGLTSSFPAYHPEPHNDPSFLLPPITPILPAIFAKNFCHRLYLKEKNGKDRLSRESR